MMRTAFISQVFLRHELAIPSCDRINKPGGPLISNEIKSIYCTALMHVLLTAHPQARNKVRDQMFTSLNPPPPRNVLIYSKILEGHLATLSFFISFWVFSACGTASYTYTHYRRMLSKSDQEKKPSAARGSALGSHG